MVNGQYHLKMDESNDNFCEEGKETKLLKRIIKEQEEKYANLEKNYKLLQDNNQLLQENNRYLQEKVNRLNKSDTGISRNYSSKRDVKEVSRECDEEDDDGRKGGSGYTKTMTLSPELAALVGQDSMARHEVVKKVWEIIKKKNLYDPKNKQFAICDDALMRVIGVKRFRTFGMMKYLNNHFIS